MTGTDPKTYALSEAAGETVAAHIAAWSQIPFTGCASSRSTPGAST